MMAGHSLRRLRRWWYAECVSVGDSIMKSLSKCSLCWTTVLVGVVSCGGQEGVLGEESGVEQNVPDAAVTSSDDGEGASESTPSMSSVDGHVALPGQTFEFELTGQVYIDLGAVRVVEGTNPERLDWDLRFDGFEAFTNGGEAGVGKGASFGPSTELDLLFDTIPEVPMRADLSDGAMTSWFWFSDTGITSRYHIYGVRDGDGRTFKVQVLSYYGGGHGQGSASYSLRFAEVTRDGAGETIELGDIDATAGGVSAPADAPAGCVDLVRGEVLALTKDEWASSADWHLCFQRTDIFLNGGLTGPGKVRAVDLDVDPSTGQDGGVTDAERARTAESERARFDAVTLAELDASHLPWAKAYDVLPRIGTRWVMGSQARPQPVPGTWFIRGAEGEKYYAVYFTEVTPASGGAVPRVQLQAKPLVPIQ